MPKIVINIADELYPTVLDVLAPVDSGEGDLKERQERVTEFFIAVLKERLDMAATKVLRLKLEEDRMKARSLVDESISA